MFLIKDRRFGMDHYVFTYKDPRVEGYQGETIEGVTLDYDLEKIHLWPEGTRMPNPRLGRDPLNTKHYKVFKFPENLNEEQYELVSNNTPIVVNSWINYRKSFYPEPEDFANSMTSDEWFDFLEQADAAWKIRNARIENDDPTKESGRNQIAEWVAKRHMSSDGGIRQIWFLDSGSPADEIRLLEVSERYTGDGTQIEPIDFGLDIEGKKFKLMVADVSSEHLDQIERDPAKTLPKDWRIEKAIIWGRRDLIR